MSKSFEQGEAVIIICGERTVAGRIELISKNQVSALVSYDGVLGEHAGMMPITRHDLMRGAYRSIIDGTEIIIKKAGAKP